MIKNLIISSASIFAAKLFLYLYAFWFEGLSEWWVKLSLTLTCLLVLNLFSLWAAYTYLEHKNFTIAKNLIISAVAMACLYTLLFIWEVWFAFIEAETFLKITFTFGVFGLLNLVWIWVAFAVKEHKELKDGNYIW